MSNYVTLLGAEDVARAGNRMSEAADTFGRAASSFADSAERLISTFQEFTLRMEAAADRIEQAKRGAL